MTMNIKIMEERKEARQFGELTKVVSAVRKLRNKLDDKEIMNTFDLDELNYATITDMIDSNPGWTNEEIAEDILGFN